jgi:hypothetical protein
MKREIEGQRSQLSTTCHAGASFSVSPKTFRLCAAQNASFDLDDAIVAIERANTRASTPGA